MYDCAPMQAANEERAAARASEEALKREHAKHLEDAAADMRLAAKGASAAELEIEALEVEALKAKTSHYEFLPCTRCLLGLMTVDKPNKYLVVDCSNTHIEQIELSWFWLPFRSLFCLWSRIEVLEGLPLVTICTHVHHLMRAPSVDAR